MFEQLPNEIFRKILELSADFGYLQLARVNKLFHANISKTRYNYIRDHFTTNTALFCPDNELMARICAELLHNMTQPWRQDQYKHINLYHAYLPISISMVITYRYDSWPKAGMCYIYIGKHEESMRLEIQYIRCGSRIRGRYTIKFVWPKQVKYRPYHTRILTFMKEYLPEVYGFTTTEHKITGAETND
jgi:hypothetical protein